jgi:NAD/NADP transhydrogenase beta subunit
MLNVEQLGPEADERGGSLTPVVISLLSTYTGFASAVAGLVLDMTTLVIGGMILVVSASVVIRWPGSKRRRMIRASHFVHR